MTMQSQAQPLISVQGVSKTYRKGKTEIPVLRGVNIDIHAGEMVAIAYIFGQSPAQEFINKWNVLHKVQRKEKAPRTMCGGGFFLYYFI